MEKRQFELIYYLVFGIFFGSSLTYMIGMFIDAAVVFGIVIGFTMLFMVYALSTDKLPRLVWRNE